MYTSNLSEIIFETLLVSIQDVSGQVSLGFLEPSGLLTQLHLKVGGPLFKLRNIGFGLLLGLLQLKDLNPQDRTFASSVVTPWRLVWRSFKKWTNYSLRVALRAANERAVEESPDSALDNRTLN